MKATRAFADLFAVGVRGLCGPSRDCDCVMPRDWQFRQVQGRLKNPSGSDCRAGMLIRFVWGSNDHCKQREHPTRAVPLRRGSL
jgi:hypothetical protein